jgi:hypothetical protein
VRHRTRNAGSSSLPGVQEEDDSKASNTEDVTELQTPRDTPQPEEHPIAPTVSDTLFDIPDIPLDSENLNSNVHRTRTGRSRNSLMTFVDSQGVFEMKVLFCACSDRRSKDEQVLRVGLFPATFKQIETLFTFSVLDNFLTDNLECKTTAQQYYSKLQSMTSSMFPDHVPVCPTTRLISHVDILS